MSQFDEALLQLIAQVSKKTQQTAIVDGEVTAVDKGAKTCTVKVDEREIPKVRINSILEAGTNVIDVFPSVGSKVVCGVVEGNPMDMYVIDTNNMDEIVINGGENLGIVKVSELVSKLNELENKVNSIVSTFNSHVHTGVTIGTASSGATATPVSGSLINTVVDDLQNEKIKH